MIIGAAYDIVTWCGVPRFYYNDLPLGNPLGKPGDRGMQRESVIESLRLVEQASEPIVVESSHRWAEDEAWKGAYMRVDDSNREQLRKLGEENRRKRRAQKAVSPAEN